MMWTPSPRKVLLDLAIRTWLLPLQLRPECSSLWIVTELANWTELEALAGAVAVLQRGVLRIRRP
jgi:hypothetical protein